MRPIKFRAWDKFQNKYIFKGFHICGEVTAFGLMDITIHETWQERSKALNYISTLEAWDDFEFEQFTGLTDKNGKDVYEGDIVRHERYEFIEALDPYAKLEVSNHEVYFDDEMLEFGLKNSNALFHCQFNDEFEVIGNIHNNPELL